MDQTQKKCEKCSLSNTKMYICSSCKSTRYCSQSCQAADWNNHRDNCNKVLQQRELDYIASSPELETLISALFMTLSIVNLNQRVAVLSYECLKNAFSTSQFSTLGFSTKARGLVPKIVNDFPANMPKECQPCAYAIYIRENLRAFGMLKQAGDMLQRLESIDSINQLTKTMMTELTPLLHSLIDKNHRFGLFRSEKYLIVYDPESGSDLVSRCTIYDVTTE